MRDVGSLLPRRPPACLHEHVSFASLPHGFTLNLHVAYMELFFRIRNVQYRIWTLDMDRTSPRRSSRAARQAPPRPPPGVGWRVALWAVCGSWTWSGDWCGVWGVAACVRRAGGRVGPRLGNGNMRGHEELILI